MDNDSNKYTKTKPNVDEYIRHATLNYTMQDFKQNL